MPGAEAGRRDTDILLCAHHLRASAWTLLTLGAPVYDHRGDLIEDIVSIFVHDR